MTSFFYFHESFLVHSDYDAAREHLIAFKKSHMKVRRTNEEVSIAHEIFNLENCVQGPVARSIVSANHWLRSIETYPFLGLLINNYTHSPKGLRGNSP